MLKAWDVERFCVDQIRWWVSPAAKSASISLDRIIPTHNQARRVAWWCYYVRFGKSSVTLRITSDSTNSPCPYECGSAHILYGSRHYLPKVYNLLRAMKRLWMKWPKMSIRLVTCFLSDTCCMHKVAKVTSSTPGWLMCWRNCSTSATRQYFPDSRVRNAFNIAKTR